MMHCYVLYETDQLLSSVSKNILAICTSMESAKKITRQWLMDINIDRESILAEYSNVSTFPELVDIWLNEFERIKQIQSLPDCGIMLEEMDTDVIY